MASAPEVKQEEPDAEGIGDAYEGDEADNDEAADGPVQEQEGEEEEEEEEEKAPPLVEVRVPHQCMWQGNFGG